MPTEEELRRRMAGEASLRNGDEYDVRQWFKTVDLEQALDTYRVVTGILEMRREAQPKRKRRSDAGQPRDEQIKLTEGK